MDFGEIINNDPRFRPCVHPLRRHVMRVNPVMVGASDLLRDGGGVPCHERGPWGGSHRLRHGRTQ